MQSERDDAFLPCLGNSLDVNANDFAGSGGCFIDYDTACRRGGTALWLAVGWTSFWTRAALLQRPSVMGSSFHNCRMRYLLMTHQRERLIWVVWCRMTTGRRRHLGRAPEAAGDRRRPRSRRGRDDGLRGRMPVPPRQALRGLGARGSRREGRGDRAADPRRDRATREVACTILVNSADVPTVVRVFRFTFAARSHRRGGASRSSSPTR